LAFSSSLQNTNTKPIITLKEARKLLGKEGEKLTDEYLMGLIRRMERVADSIIDSALVPINEKV
jgi:hypothetical protein